MDKEYFECDCSEFDHTMRVAYFKEEPDFMYVEVHLRQKSFFRRLWAAIKYVFGRRSDYGDFDEFLWTPKTAEKMRDLCDEFIKTEKNFDYAEYYERQKRS